jgi:imidazolonepropionase-like amidohydrolase
MWVITGATTLVGAELEPVPDSVVVIDGSTITAVGRRQEVPVPDHFKTVDGTGMTLIPGFIDAHVHIGFYPPAAVLAGGVTTVRDLGWPHELIFPLVATSQSTGFEGPRILAAGRILTASGGYPTRAAWAPAGTGLEVAGPDDAHAAVDQVARAGACIVKIALEPNAGPVLDRATLGAIVAAAHSRGLRVTGHVSGLRELDKALEAEVDELAHMLMSDEVIPEPTIRRMVDAAMTVVPTLSIFSGRAQRTAIANLHAFRRAGGRVVYGTDLGNEGPTPGIDAGEVRAMAHAGLSGVEIITSATVESARWLGLDATGAIAAGKDADLVMIDGDPSSDPHVLTAVRQVWRKGATAS